uniref:Uncharacterized protein n=1 Tax=Panagrolaimus superbus TaxID=310955 RepID=A0A914ZAF8_9BILA
MIRKKDASTRLIKPTLPELFVDEVLYLVENWESDWEYNGEIEIFDEGIAQYLLVGQKSHAKFYAALILNKPSLRCSLVPEEPFDSLEEEAENTIHLVYSNPVSPNGEKDLNMLQEILGKRGFRFVKQ